MSKFANKFEELQYAKEAVIFMLNHENGLVDMHSLEYWAGVVTQLRKEIRENL